MATTVAEVDHKVDHLHGMKQMEVMGSPSFVNAFGEEAAFKKLQNDVIGMRELLADFQRKMTFGRPFCFLSTMQCNARWVAAQGNSSN